MTLTPEITVNLDLRDAIAYEFFLSRIESVLEESDRIRDGKEVENMFLLAECAFHVGDIFIAVREKHENKIKFASDAETKGEVE